jgi:CPA1 family monovalent cation:H+ antiporter
MPGISLVLLLLAVLLTLTSLLQPLANRLRLPFTVLLAGLGVALGVWSVVSVQVYGMGPISELSVAIRGMDLSAQAILFSFLPILLFQTGLTIDVRRMLDDLAPILMLAVVAVLVCTLFVGGALAWTSEQTLVVCLLLGAIVATTDPVAVVGLFRDVGAPRRLSILVEGESLLNDAAAIALFAVLLQVLVPGGEALSLTDGVWLFVKGFLGGAAFGYAAARFAIVAIAALRNLPLAETSVTVALAYLVFIVAERYLAVSGVVAVVVAAMVVGSTGRTRISPGTWAGLTAVWNQLGFWASTLVFIFASMLVPRFLDEALRLEHAWLLLVLVAAALAARWVVLYGLLPALTAANLAARVPASSKLVILWGGLRGAVTLVLALGVTEHPTLDPEVKGFVAVLATGFVLFTLLVNATTLRPMMRLLGLDKLPPIEQVLRNRSVALALQSVGERIGETAERHHIRDDVAEEVVADFRRRLEQALTDPQSRLPLTEVEELRLGLIALSAREEELYLRHYANQTVSRRTVVGLLAKAGRVRDGAKTAGRIGYLSASRDTGRFKAAFRLGGMLHRRFGARGPLAARLADRFETVVITRMVIESLRDYNARMLAPLVGRQTCDNLDEVIATRLESCRQSLDALRLQYPAYERALETRFLRLAALRMEAAEYRTMFEESVISQEIHADLDRRLRAEEARLAVRPDLDLGLDTKTLVRGFPMFGELGDDRIDVIAGLLRPRFAYPGERLITAGERGDAMYFISSGAVEVYRHGHLMRLGSGDFFGEMALLTGKRRTATVTAIAYCSLLVLQGKDFRRFLKANEDLRGRIREVADRRLSEIRERQQAERL